MKLASMKAKLTSEIRRLESEKIGLLRVDSVAKAFDGKVMNKKFTDAIVAIEKLVDKNGQNYSNYGASYTKTGQRHHLAVYKFIRGTNTTLVQIHHAERAEVVVNNRLNYSKLHEIIMSQVNWRESELQKLHDEIENGEQYISEYNQLVNQLNQMYNELSATFKNSCGSAFNSVMRG